MRMSFKETVATGKATSYEVYVKQLEAWFSSIVGPIKVNDAVTSVSILNRDITHQKKTELPAVLSNRTFLRPGTGALR